AMPADNVSPFKPLDRRDGAGPRGEGGPEARLRAFLGPRLAVLRPREESERLRPARAEHPRATGRAGADDAEPAEALPASFRRDLMALYRERKRQAESDPARSAPAEWKPPQPAPANNWTPIGPSVVRQGLASNRPAVSGRVAGLTLA